MCGLFGMFTHPGVQLNENQLKIKKRIVLGLALAMEERGNQSAGLAAIRDSESVIFKKAITPTEFVKTKDFSALLDLDPSILIGHTRLKTHGEINDENAHPFHIGNIIGAHNGVVSNYVQVYSQAKVDSEAIFFQLNKDNNNYVKSFANLSGNMAVTWVDTTNTRSVCVVRHGTSPLSLAYIPDIGSYAWCSLESSLKAVLGGALDTLPAQIGSIAEDTVIRLKARKSQFETKKKKVTFKSQYASNYSNNHQSGYQYPHNSDHFDWMLGHTSFFLTPSFALEREKALLDGCVHCEKPIITTEGFYFCPTTNEAFHKYACGAAYANKYFEKHKKELYYYSFTPAQHEEVRTKIWTNVFGRDKKQKDKNTLMVSAAVDDDCLLQVVGEELPFSVVETAPLTTL